MWLSEEFEENFWIMFSGIWIYKVNLFHCLKPNPDNERSEAWNLGTVFQENLKNVVRKFILSCSSCQIFQVIVFLETLGDPAVKSVLVSHRCNYSVMVQLYIFRLCNLYLLRWPRAAFYYTIKFVVFYSLAAVVGPTVWSQLPYKQVWFSSEEK